MVNDRNEDFWYFYTTCYLYCTLPSINSVVKFVFSEGVSGAMNDCGDDSDALASLSNNKIRESINKYTECIAPLISPTATDGYDYVSIESI